MRPHGAAFASIATLAFALAFVPAATLAQAPSTLSYQGVLTDAAGVIVPDGNYNLTFRLYSVASGGSAIYTENQPAVAVERGGFSVVIGLVSEIGLTFDQTYFLGIQVGADPELAPRVRLTASPYAMGLRLPLSHGGSSPLALLQLDNSGAGPDARFRGLVEVGDATSTGTLDLRRSGGSQSIVSLFSNSQGGCVALDQEEGNAHSSFQADVNGTGGFLSVNRTTGAPAFTVDGNTSGTGEPTVTISGSTRSASLNMGQAGDGSVVLPSDAISSTEVFDEPGVASAIQIGTIALNGPTQTLASRTLTVPAAGYCLVIASAEAAASHTNGVLSAAYFGVSDDAAVIPANQTVASAFPSGAASGIYDFPVTVHGLFQVGAGSHTFYLLGAELGGSYSIQDIQLTILFVPTAYGTVTPTLTAEIGDDHGRMSRPQGTEVTTEQQTAARFDRDRVEGEMAAMRAQMAELRRRLDAVLAEQLATRGTARRD